MNPPDQPFIWGPNPFSPDEWHQLHELWMLMSPGTGEFLLSYCYGKENGQHRCCQFGPPRDIRFPVSGDIEASPKLATRAVVARPNQPVHLPAGEQITLYVGTALWLCLTHGKSTLLDIAVAQLSDSWFGPNTRRGEICYACQTHARLSMEGVAGNPWKAITPITIRNESGAALLLDRINLPLPNLTLYKDEDRYWTSGVTITRRAAGSLGEVEISKGAPAECTAAQELATARQPTDTSVWHKAADLLLG